MKISLAVLFSALVPALPAAAQGFDPPVAIDINPDPTIVEVNLSATVTTWQYIPGVDTTVWAYSDDSPGGSGASVPGPTIKANVGDTLRVHFTNNLPETTTIHWHGIENYADQDGSHISQLHVPPGGTFDYEFPLLQEGLYWYHPHVRTFDQIEKGLHAGLLVKDPAKDAIAFGSIGSFQVEEHIIFFDDILLDVNNEVVPAFSFSDPLQNALYHLNGRVGNVLLVNGKEAGTVNLPVTNRCCPELVHRQRGQHHFLSTRDHESPRSRGAGCARRYLGDRLGRGLRPVPVQALPGVHYGTPRRPSTSVSSSSVRCIPGPCSSRASACRSSSRPRGRTERPSPSSSGTGSAAATSRFGTRP